jgi:outer membrane biosynthesis protein TonB
MGGAALVVGAAIPLSMLVFCGAPAQPPVHAPGPPVAEPAPSGTAPITPGSDGGTEEGRTAGEPSASPLTDDSGVGEGDASMRSPDSGLSADQVRQVVVAHHGALHACYESEAQKNPTFRGSVTLAWTIDASGAVISASITSSTLHNPRAEACILHQVRTWQFPSSDRPSQVQAFPLSFGVGR